MTYAANNIDDFLNDTVFKGQDTGFFVDCAAANGITYNNTKLFEDKGWSGICIEPEPSQFAELSKNRKCICVNACITGNGRDVEFVIAEQKSGLIEHEDKELKEYRKACNANKLKIKSIILSQVLRESNAPKEIDLFSLDVEGAEVEILETFPFSQYHFKAAIIEHCHNNSNRLHEIMTTNGYKRIAEYPWDWVYTP